MRKSEPTKLALPEFEGEDVGRITDDGSTDSDSE